MRVVCPHAGEPHPDTIATLAAWGGSVELVDISGSPYAYGQLLRELWAAGEDFLIVEQDIVASPAAFAEMITCPNPYCAAPYPWSTTLGPALGFTRFRSLLLRCHPLAADIACRLPSDYGEPGHWRQLDVRLMQSVLRDHVGLQPCCHPPVEHRNPASRLIRGAGYTSTVDGRSYLEPGTVEMVAATVASGR